MFETPAAKKQADLLCHARGVFDPYPYMILGATFLEWVETKDGSRAGYKQDFSDVLTIKGPDKTFRLAYQRKKLDGIYIPLARLDATIFLAGTHAPDYVLTGWLPVEDVEQWPITEVEIGEERVEAHYLDHGAFFPFKDTTFQQRCDHGNGYWEDRKNAWRCFGCDRLRYDETSFDLIRRTSDSTR